MKAMLISEVFPPQHGGSGRWFWELYSRLSHSDYLLAVGKHADYRAFDQLHDLQVERLNLSSNNWGLKSLNGLKFYWQTFWSLSHLIKNNDIEQLHCGRCLPEGFMAYLLHKAYGTPYLSFIHGEDVETASTSRELSWIINRVFSKASVLICNSQNTANILLDKWQIPADKVIVLHPGVDTLHFSPMARDLSVREHLAWDARPVVITVGRLQERKGHDILIQALVELKKELPDVLYVIIGSGERKAFLHELVVALGLKDNVQFLDEITDEILIQCYQQCDLFVLPNRQIGNDIEGFGMVLVEAQACGKPVIAGDSGGTAETLLEGKTGFVVDCTVPDQLAKVMGELLSNPARLAELGESARSHVQAHFDWGELSGQAEVIFKQHVNK